MANDVSSRVWYIDTASAVPVWLFQCFVKFIEVVGGTAGTVGNPMATMTDINGKPIVTSLYQTAAAGEIQTYNLENWFRGFVVSALGAGVTLRVHVK